MNRTNEPVLWLIKQTIQNRRQSEENECRDYGSLAKCLLFSILLARFRRRRAQYGKNKVEGKSKFHFGFVCATWHPRRAEATPLSPCTRFSGFTILPNQMPDIHSVIVGKLSLAIVGETKQTNQSDCNFSPKRLSGTASCQLRYRTDFGLLTIDKCS